MNVIWEWLAMCGGIKYWMLLYSHDNKLIKLSSTSILETHFLIIITFQTLQTIENPQNFGKISVISSVFQTYLVANVRDMQQIVANTLFEEDILK